MLAGMSHVSKSADVRKAYRFVLLSLFMVTLLVDALGIWAAWEYIRAAPDAAKWLTLAMSVLRVLAVLAVILLSPLFAITACNVLFPVFSEIPFLAGMRAFDLERGVRLGQRPGLSDTVAIVHSLRRFAKLLLASSGCFLLSFIPIVGTFAAPALHFYFAARAIGWEMMDPYFDKLGLPWDGQVKVVKAYAPELLGLGLVCVPLLAIPIIGPTFFGLLQAGAARFVIRIFPEGDAREDLLPSGA